MFQEDGFTIVASVISPEVCDELVAAVTQQNSEAAGSRALLAVPAVARVGESLRRHPALSGLIGERHTLMQCSLFAKGVGANWSVTPHQDLSIPVSERIEAPGWTGWSMKEGSWFVQPPVEVLEQFIAIRVQLDDHADATGPLEVVPGSHTNGRLASAEVSQRASTRVRCEVPRGGALVMRPLIIHASGKSRSEFPRRVLHYLYGPPLPLPLR